MSSCRVCIDSGIWLYYNRCTFSPQSDILYIYSQLHTTYESNVKLQIWLFSYRYYKQNQLFIISNKCHNSYIVLYIILYMCSLLTQQEIANRPVLCDLYNVQLYTLLLIIPPPLQCTSRCTHLFIGTQICGPHNVCYFKLIEER